MYPLVVFYQSNSALCNHFTGTASLSSGQSTRCLSWALLLLSSRLLFLQFYDLGNSSSHQEFNVHSRALIQDNNPKLNTLHITVAHAYFLMNNPPIKPICLANIWLVLFPFHSCHPVPLFLFVFMQLCAWFGMDITMMRQED